MTEKQEIKTDLKKAFAKHRLNVLAGFKPVPVVDIPEIPLERSLFPGSKDDWWYLESSTKEETSCIYELAPFGEFPTHLHLVSMEKGDLLTKGAKVEWVTERGIEFLEYPNSFESIPGEEHALVSLVDFHIKIRVKWIPGMIGWNAIFKDIQQKQTYKNK